MPMCYAKHLYLKKDVNWEETTSIEIPEGIENIGDYQFYGFDNVTSITIPNSVTSIGKYAFYNCNGLESSVTSIGNNAFDDCRLHRVYYNGSVEDWDSINIMNFNGSLIGATRYYYSSVKPANDGYKYWYYDMNGNIVEW